MKRRNFIKTSGLVAGGALASGGIAAQEKTIIAQDECYPPARTGLRGAHNGAFEAAHALAWKGPIPTQQLCGPVEQYDLIIIGLGVSGLSSAYFYKKLINQDAKILILDNHDDFGGHATRNEFSIDGKTYITYGGDQSIVNPS
jgi:spermidine dehydrogenase